MVFISCVLAVLYGSVAFAQTASDTLPLRRTVVDRVLTSDSSPRTAVSVDDRFTYVAGQRFILRDVVDAEQHFFVVADREGAIQEMYWIQFEEFLPDVEGQYAYPESGDIVIGELGFGVHVRHYDTPPVDDSDRGAAYRFLEGLGYHVPIPALRARLVHIPDDEPRTELMVIYMEAVESAGQIGPRLEASFTKRAVESIAFGR